MASALPLVSYKIRFRDPHVRAVPAFGLDGAPFTGPGVDLRGPDAAAAIAGCSPVLAWLEEREPAVVVRALSVRTAGPRVLLSLESIVSSDPRPRAMRFDPPWADELRERGREAERFIGEACARTLERRHANTL